jgi:hypothetical protein
MKDLILFHPHPPDQYFTPLPLFWRGWGRSYDRSLSEFWGGTENMARGRPGTKKGGCLYF